MKLKFTYSSGVKPEIVDIGDLAPQAYIEARFGAGRINELIKNGGSYAIVEDAPLTLEDIAPVPTFLREVAEEVEQAPVVEKIPKPEFQSTGPFTAESAIAEDA